MKNAILFNIVLADLIRDIGADKSEALVRTYGEYLAYEFGDDLSDEDLLKRFEAIDGIGIAYTTSGDDEEWELQATYDWRNEEMVYTASDGEQSFEERSHYSIDDAIKYGFNFDEAYHNCNRLTYDD